MNASEERSAAANSPRLSRPKLRDIARLWINTFRAFYAGDVGVAPVATASPATASREAGSLTGQGAPGVAAMGNLQSDAKKKGKKGRGTTEGTASTPDSIADGLEDATDTGDDGETGDTEETPAKKTQSIGRTGDGQKGGTEKLRPTHKRQAPRPPGFAERQVPEAKLPEVPERPRQEGEEKVEKKDESQDESVDTIVLTETKEKDEASNAVVAVSDQSQKQGPALLVTDSWRLANKSLVVTEISMQPSQESSSGSVFTDPEEVAGAQRL